MPQSPYLLGGSIRFDAGQPDGARRLTDALGQLLQVNQLCLLVGSGASAHLGSPPIRTVTNEALLRLIADAGVTLTDQAESVLGAVAGDETDLEALLGRLSSARAYCSAFDLTSVTVGKVNATPAVVSEAFKAVNVALARACDLPRPEAPLAAPHDSDPWYSHRELFRRILASRRPDAPRVRVFTTNYDLVIERTLDDCGINYFDGFVGGVRRALNLASYGRELVSSSEGGRGSAVRVHDLLLLYKLHGSLNWRVDSSPASFGSTRIVQSSVLPQGDELSVIYPTPTKEVDVLGHPYADLLREFAVSLTAPECALLIVGYGFADEHINRLIFEALAQNSTLQVFVADPFGAVDLGDASAEPAIRTDTAIGRLASVEDARISVLAGDVAIFPSLATSLPDVAERSTELQSELENALAQALLATTPTDEPDAPG